jgi:hypothetical protein
VVIDQTGKTSKGWEEVKDRVIGCMNRTQDIELLSILNAARSCLYFHEKLDEELARATHPSKPETTAANVAKETFRSYVLDEFLSAELESLEGTPEKGEIFASLFDDFDIQDWGGGTRLVYLANPTLTTSTDSVLSSEATWATSFQNDYKTFHESYQTHAKAPQGPAVRVAIIDTGIDKRYMGLYKVLKGSRSWIETEDQIKDTHGHGTYCAYFLHTIAPYADIYVARAFKGRDITLKEADNISEVSTNSLLPAANVSIDSVPRQLCML